MLAGTNQTPLTFEEIKFRVDQLMPDRVCASAERQFPTKCSGKAEAQCLRQSQTKSGPMDVTKAYKIS